MTIKKVIKGIKKHVPTSQGSPGRRRLVVVFMAGMVMTAALAHTQVAADMLSPRLEEPVAPVVPGTLDLIEPGADWDTGRPVIIELV